MRWATYPEGLRSIGHEGDGFAFDNETPRHPVYLGPFRIASRLATCGEYLAFLDDGGYDRPELWLSDDANHIVLQMKSGLSFGSFNLYLTSYRPKGQYILPTGR